MNTLIRDLINQHQSLVETGICRIRHRSRLSIKTRTFEIVGNLDRYIHTTPTVHTAHKQDKCCSIKHLNLQTNLNLSRPNGKSIDRTIESSERKQCIHHFRGKLGQVSSRSRLWDRHWGQNKRREAILSSVMYHTIGRISASLANLR